MYHHRSQITHVIQRRKGSQATFEQPEIALHGLVTGKQVQAVLNHQERRDRKGDGDNGKQQCHCNASAHTVM